jgi:hypothetical protein
MNATDHGSEDVVGQVGRRSGSASVTLTLLLEKVDRILLLLETRPGPARQPVVGEDTGKEMPSPRSTDDITRHQERFEKLYGNWDAGEGLQVVDELVAMHADELRKFANANNLNVTSKTPKGKVMKLIAGRFRERQQLMRSHFNRRSATD